MADKEKVQGRTAALVAAMEQVFATMDPVTRDIFVRHWLDCWSYQRIASARGIDVREVETHIARAVSALDLGLARLGL